MLIDQTNLTNSVIVGSGTAGTSTSGCIGWLANPSTVSIKNYKILSSTINFAHEHSSLLAGYSAGVSNSYTLMNITITNTTVSG